MSKGDYITLQRENIPVNVSIALTGSAIAATTIATVRSASHNISVQRIVLSITTHAVGKVFTIQDDNGTPLVIANRSDLAAAAGVPDVVVWDFGPNGQQITPGKSLQVVANTGGAGFVGVFHIEGYQKLNATVAVASTN